VARDAQVDLVIDVWFSVVILPKSHGQGGFGVAVGTDRGIEHVKNLACGASFNRERPART